MSLVKTGGMVGFKRIGLNQASTFTGFCATHDNRTFAPLEKRLITASSEQCFLMSYRAICRELFQKRIHHDIIEVMRTLDQGRPLAIQEEMQWFVDLHEIGTMMGVAETQYHINIYETMLKNRNFDSYRRVIIRFSCIPDVLSTGAFAPEYDFAGHGYQDLADDPPLKNIAVTVLPAEGGGIAVLGWHPESDEVCIPFAKSLMSLQHGQLGDAVVRLIFEHIENTFFRPSWWVNLPQLTKKALIRRANSGANPTVPRESNSLMDDGFRYVSWPVDAVEATFQ